MRVNIKVPQTIKDKNIIKKDNLLAQLTKLSPDQAANLTINVGPLLKALTKAVVYLLRKEGIK